MQEGKLLCRRQEVLTGLVEDKSRLQSQATEKYDETIFEEQRESEEKKSKEALLLVQKKAHFYLDVQVCGHPTERISAPRLKLDSSTFPAQPAGGT